MCVLPPPPPRPHPCLILSLDPPPCSSPLPCALQLDEVQQELESSQHIAARHKARLTAALEEAQTLEEALQRERMGGSRLRQQLQLLTQQQQQGMGVGVYDYGLGGGGGPGMGMLMEVEQMQVKRLQQQVRWDAIHRQLIIIVISSASTISSSSTSATAPLVAVAYDAPLPHALPPTQAVRQQELNSQLLTEQQQLQAQRQTMLAQLEVLRADQHKASTQLEAGLGVGVGVCSMWASLLLAVAWL